MGAKWPVTRETVGRSYGLCKLGVRSMAFGSYPPEGPPGRVSPTCLLRQMGKWRGWKPEDPSGLANLRDRKWRIGDLPRTPKCSLSPASGKFRNLGSGGAGGRNWKTPSDTCEIVVVAADAEETAGRPYRPCKADCGKAGPGRPKCAGRAGSPQNVGPCAR